MQLKVGDMWSVWNESDLFLITTNSTIKSDGSLVMGAGIAKEARDRFPGLDLIAGNLINKTCGNLGTYHLLLSPDWPNKKLGLFQVKLHYSSNADLKLIQGSVDKLTELALQYKGAKINMNYPGIGNGGLARSKVEKIIMTLPDNITVWEKGK